MKVFFAFFFLLFFVSQTFADWKVDFSRREGLQASEELKPLPLTTPQEEKTFMGFTISTGEPMQEVVILNTPEGFVPSTVRLRVGLNYKITLVNINESARNVSFVLDSFSEFHATYYGQVKNFFLKPAQEGVFTYVSPETAAKGRLVVYPRTDGPSPVLMRAPASE